MEPTYNSYCGGQAIIYTKNNLHELFTKEIKMIYVCDLLKRSSNVKTYCTAHTLTNNDRTLIQSNNEVAEDVLASTISTK